MQHKKQQTAELFSLIEAVRETLRLTWEKLAARMEVDRSLFFHVKSGKSGFSPRTLEKFNELLREAGFPALHNLSRETTNPELFKERLKSLRISRHLSMEEFAKTIRFHKSYISRLESGVNTNPSGEFIDAVCRAFAVRREWLITGHGPSYDGPTAANLIPPPDSPVHVAYETKHSLERRPNPGSFGPEYSLLSSELLVKTLQELSLQISASALAEMRAPLLNLNAISNELLVRTSGPRQSEGKRNPSTENGSRPDSPGSLNPVASETKG